MSQMPLMRDMCKFPSHGCLMVFYKFADGLNMWRSSWSHIQYIPCDWLMHLIGTPHYHPPHFVYACSALEVKAHLLWFLLHHHQNRNRFDRIRGNSAGWASARAPILDLIFQSNRVHWCSTDWKDKVSKITIKFLACTRSTFYACSFQSHTVLLFLLFEPPSPFACLCIYRFRDISWR